MNQIWYPKSENLDDQHIQGTIKKKRVDFISNDIKMQYRHIQSICIEMQFLHTDSSDPEFKGRKFQDTATDWSDTGWVEVKVHFSFTLVPLTTSISFEV